MKNCCDGCKDRKPGCHDLCEKYQAFVVKNEEIKARRKKYMFEESVAGVSALRSSALYRRYL